MNEHVIQALQQAKSAMERAKSHKAGHGIAHDMRVIIGMIEEQISHLKEEQRLAS